ncbi:hypothetical protein D3C87_1037560 [compost metagenome]
MAPSRSRRRLRFFWGHRGRRGRGVAGQGGRQHAHADRRQHLHRRHHGRGGHASGRQCRCVRAEQCLHRQWRHPGPGRLEPRCLQPGGQWWHRGAGLADLERGQRQHEHHLRRGHHWNQRQAGQERHRHADPHRGQYLQRRQRDQRRRSAYQQRPGARHRRGHRQWRSVGRYCGPDTGQPVLGFFWELDGGSGGRHDTHIEAFKPLPRLGRSIRRGQRDGVGRRGGLTQFLRRRSAQWHLAGGGRHLARPGKRRRQRVVVFHATHFQDHRGCGRDTGFQRLLRDRLQPAWRRSRADGQQRVERLEHFRG